MSAYATNNLPGMLDQGSQKEGNCCYNTICWTIQIACWATLILSIVMYTKDPSSTDCLIIFGILYVFYLSLEFCSPTSRYLCNKSSDQGMYEKMGRNFRTPPVICFHCECYHYVTVTYYTRDKNGHRHRHTRREKRVTYRETYNFPYYSERDVSGLFYLNCEKAYIEKKHYIKLELKEEINFADAISYYDYDRAKSNFWRRNRFRDVHFNFWETRTIPGMEHHNLVKLTVNEPFMVNYFFFVIFTILTFAEFYVIYVDSFCIYQKFTVRKVVSTRYDLNQPVYQIFIPQLNLISNQYQYDQDYYNYLNQSYQLQLPSQEELEAAKQYQNKVPDYQVSSFEGGLQSKVVIDNPGYSSYNLNEAPAEFAAVSGDVALSQNQINQNGGPPPGYDKPGFEFQVDLPDQEEINKDNKVIGYTSADK